MSDATDQPDDFRRSVLRARQILERQVAGTPVAQVDARIEQLRRSGMTTRAENLLRARIAAHGTPCGLQTDAAEHKKGSS